MDGIALFAFEVHLHHNVRKNQVLFVRCDNLITPNLRDEFVCGSRGYAIRWGKCCYGHNISPKGLLNPAVRIRLHDLVTQRIIAVRVCHFQPNEVCSSVDFL